MGLGNRARLSGVDGRSHPGVVHTGNGQAHHDGGNELLPAIGGSKCQPQCRRRCADRYDHGERNEERVVADLGVTPHGRHAGVVHGDDANSHENAAENEAKDGYPRAADDVEAAAGYEDRQYEGKASQFDVVGHRDRHNEGEHADEVHRPYAAPHRDRGRRQPYAARRSPSRLDSPAKIERGVGCEASDQNGQSNEIRIVCSGNDHWDRPNFWNTAGRISKSVLQFNVPGHRRFVRENALQLSPPPFAPDPSPPARGR